MTLAALPAPASPPDPPLWLSTYGGSKDEQAWAVETTPDGGCVVTGYTESFTVPARGGWVVKLARDGSIEWEHVYSSWSETASFIQPTGEDGYVLAGYRWPQGQGYPDVWVARLAIDGSVRWQNDYGGVRDDWASCIRQTADGGYVVAGETASWGAGMLDIWVVKLAADGSVEWQKTYGGPLDDTSSAEPIQQTEDGGYIVTGRTASFSLGEGDFWVLKLDARGNVEWQKTYGGAMDDYARSIKATPDGGYVVGGYTKSFGAGGWDLWVLKLDAVGDVEWQNAYGGPEDEVTWSAQLTKDGGVALGGYTRSSTVGDRDALVVRLDRNGDVVWQSAIGGAGSDWTGSIRQTAEGGFITVGGTRSFGAGGEDWWALRLDADGTIPGCPLVRRGNLAVTPTNAVGRRSTATVTSSTSHPVEAQVLTHNTVATVISQCRDEGRTARPPRRLVNVP